MAAAENSTTSSSSRSGVGGASADSYIGSLISLTSKSEIRYEGILYNINTEESSIGLRNVRSFGTEGRKMDGPQVPPSDKIYEYILFRGSDIKDLQVKASPPVQATPPINSDPAIIQSHYPSPSAPPASLPTAPSVSLTNVSSHSVQTGLPTSNFQGGMPLYQPGGNMNSWGPSPPNMPMYWPGYYGTPNGLPQLPQQPLFQPPPGLSIPHSMQFSGFNTSLPNLAPNPPGSNVPDHPQQSLLRPPSGLSIPHSMQQMQFSAFSTSLPASSLPSSKLPDNQSSLVRNSAISSNLTSSSLPTSSFPLNVPPLQPNLLQSEPMVNPLPNKAPTSFIHTSTPGSFAMPSISIPNNAGRPFVASKPSVIPGPVTMPPHSLSQPVSSVAGKSGAVFTETATPSLITPGQLLQSGSTAVSAPQSLQTVQKDVEVVQVSSKPLPESSVRVARKAQPPILPLPTSNRAHKPNGGYGGAYRNNYRGHGGREPGISHPMTKFTEEFDFMAMNEKFKKDEVWGHLGKSNKSPSSKDKGHVSDGDEEDSQYDFDNVESPKTKTTTPIYNKDDFFDSLSCTTLDNDPNHGRTRYSEQMKLDTETFGDFSRFRGGRGGRGPVRGSGGGRFRGYYNGRGGGYGGGYGGYGGRGRGRGVQNYTS